MVGVDWVEDWVVDWVDWVVRLVEKKEKRSGIQLVHLDRVLLINVNLKRTLRTLRNNRRTGIPKLGQES